MNEAVVTIAQRVKTETDELMEEAIEQGSK